ncbi:hypothetical protein EVAR_24482_1 [Eumeta japonica]|uniref:Uncharacterized protein n=1 Tax=Eumeta variegata TaxID=151549 RepID=A0A4C1WUS5_EUMVA|nr:hypothetical protein EVAR_24482_1 [Eumeta japonica]
MTQLSADYLDLHLCSRGAECIRESYAHLQFRECRPSTRVVHVSFKNANVSRLLDLSAPLRRAWLGTLALEPLDIVQESGHFHFRPFSNFELKNCLLRHDTRPTGKLATGAGAGNAHAIPAGHYSGLDGPAGPGRGRARRRLVGDVTAAVNLRSAPARPGQCC